MADDAPLLLRVADTGQGVEEAFPGIGDVQVGVKVVPKSGAHGLGFAAPQQAVVNEDAGHLRPSGPDQHCGRHRRIDTA